jgi:hypothetical protein
LTFSAPRSVKVITVLRAPDDGRHPRLQEG